MSCEVMRKKEINMDSTLSGSEDSTTRHNIDRNKNNCYIQKEGKENTVHRVLQENFNCSSRYVTDKHWCSFFFFIFIIWILSWYCVIYHKSDFANDYNKMFTKNVSELRRYYVWGENWLFDMMTCNAAFLGNHYENSGPIVILANVLFCGSLIIYSLSSMRKDEIFYTQLKWSGACLGMWTLCYRLIVSGKLCYRQHLPSFIPFQKNFEFWLMPEVIFVMILYAKRPDQVVDLTEAIGNSFLPFRMLIFYIIGIGFLLYLFLAFLIQSTITILDESGENSLLSYVIAACSCYLGLVIYYFGMMVASLITDVTLTLNDDMLHENWRILIDTPLSALMTVGRYHFGTVCYHATLVFPRLETSIVINEPEVTKLPGFLNITDRFFLAHRKLHNLSLITTVSYGLKHSESIRKLSMVFASDLPRLEYFQGFNQISISLLALLMSTNSLLLISLWTYGVYDSRLSLATWALYIYVILAVSACLQIYDAVLDTIMFYMDPKQVDCQKITWFFTNKSFLLLK